MRPCGQRESGTARPLTPVCVCSRRPAVSPVPHSRLRRSQRVQVLQVGSPVRRWAVRAAAPCRPGSAPQPPWRLRGERLWLAQRWQQLRLSVWAGRERCAGPPPRCGRAGPGRLCGRAAQTPPWPSPAASWLSPAPPASCGVHGPGGRRARARRGWRERRGRAADSAAATVLWSCSPRPAGVRAPPPCPALRRPPCALTGPSCQGAALVWRCGCGSTGWAHEQAAAPAAPARVLLRPAGSAGYQLIGMQSVAVALALCDRRGCRGSTSSPNLHAWFGLPHVACDAQRISSMRMGTAVTSTSHATQRKQCKRGRTLARRASKTAAQLAC
jgi:hypothetical protein